MITDMLEHNEEMSSEMDSIIKKIHLQKVLKDINAIFVTKSANFSLDCLGATF